MKNSSLKGALGALAVVGVALAAKRMSERKKAFKGIFNEYDIKARNPFDFADKIRGLDDEKYAELKGKLQEKFASKCGHKNRFRQETSEA